MRKMNINLSFFFNFGQTNYLLWNRCYNVFQHLVGRPLATEVKSKDDEAFSEGVRRLLKDVCFPCIILV